MADIEWKQIAPERGEFGDCTAVYKLILDKQYTVGELISQYILSLSEDWGYITVTNDKLSKGWWPKSTLVKQCRYKYGNMVDELPSNDILNKQIKEVVCWGGYTNYDYIVCI